MQLNDVLAFSEDQNRGAWLDLADPVTGKPTGLRVLVVGPDSARQADARLTLADELADMADHDGRVAARGYGVICDPESGGCGASSGAARNHSGAIAMWNNHPSPYASALTAAAARRMGALA